MPGNELSEGLQFSFNSWLDSALTQPISAGVKAFNFHLREPWSVEIIGSDSYCEYDDSWACEETCLQGLPLFELPESTNSGTRNEVQETVKNLVLAYMARPSGGVTILRKAQAVTLGFVDDTLQTILPEAPEHRAHILGMLELLGSEEQQLTYERNVPHVNITAEMICLWGDDTYRPENFYFCSCFTESELAALAEFDQFFQAQRQQLPESRGTVRTWLASAPWRAIMRKAEETAARFVADGAQPQVPG